MTRIALGIEYDGAAFHGWQSQPHGLTVQDVLELALSSVAGQAVRVNCAGRTDTGVHALGQVVHFDCAASRTDQAWVRGGNAHLPPQVAIRWAQSVDERFHARFDARSRSYCYLLHNHPVRPALQHARVGWHYRPLAIEPMQAAIAALRGEHDFSAFRAAECQAKSPIKTMHHAEVRRVGEMIVFEFRASAFLQHMVRNMVGALVHVGLSREPVESIASLLASRDRTRAAPTFSPAGLYLTGVEYDAHWNIPATPRIMPSLFTE